MRTEELDFPLPDELIALHPPAARSASRLLAVRCAAGEWRHRGFRDLPDLLRPEDLLVFNDTRVVPARVVGHKDTGGRVEGLWLREHGDGLAEFLLSGSRLRPGVEIQLAIGKNRLRLASKLAPGRWLLEDVGRVGWLRLLSESGATPLPPYIRSRRETLGEADDSAEDRIRYQTVFAEAAGAVAAPTAALHFDDEILAALDARGVRRVALTLHVGPGTFQPITAPSIEDHAMHRERYSVPPATLEALRRQRDAGGRVVAVGTTVCRVLESLPETPWPGAGLVGETGIFLRPGSPFRWTDALLTNFHTPSSTLLALVAAFAEARGAPRGLDFVKRVYAAAVAERYRFFSYGDSSFWER